MIGGIDILAAVVAAFMILGPMAAGAMHTAHDRAANAPAATEQSQ